jgi:hypothetical protein
MADHLRSQVVSAGSRARARRALDCSPWLVGSIVLLAGTAGAAPGVVVWGGGVEDERAVAEAGFEPVPFSPIAERLAAARDAAAARETAALDAVEAGLRDVRAAYLEQRFDDMLVALAGLEGDHLDVLSMSEHIAALWDVEFQLGLAYHARRADGDAARARERFALALAIDGNRRPEKDLYGPRVAAAFADAVAARDAETPRPVRVVPAPADALVVVDGVPVVDRTRPRSLRTGWHVVRAVAPGYDALASLVRVTGGELALPLPAAADGIGAAEPTPATDSGLRALRAIAGAAGAAIVVHVERGGGSVRAIVVTRDAVSEPISAVVAALARIAPDGSLRAGGPLPPPPPPKPSIWSRWWFWTGVGAIAVGAIAIGVAASSGGPDHLRVFGPGERP